MKDVGRSVGPSRDPGRLVEQRRAERARGVPPPQRALEPEQQRGLPLCRAHDGAGWLPPEQTGVLSVVLGDGEWFSEAGVLVARRGLRRRTLAGRFFRKVEMPTTRRSPQVWTHPLERGIPPTWASEWGEDRQHGPWCAFEVRDAVQRLAGSHPGFSGWGRRRMKKIGFRTRDRDIWCRSIPASGCSTRLAHRPFGKP